MNTKTLFKWSLLGLMLVTLQGCQIIRLHQFKNQLNDLKQHVTFSTHRLILNHPILEPTDILYITKTEPSDIIPTEETITWQYHLIKQTDATDTQPVHLSFELLFNNQQLHQVTYPKEIAELFSDYLIQLGFESVSKGTYLAKNNVLIPGEPDDYIINKQDLPTQQHVIAQLGPPTEMTTNATNNVITYVYRYTVKNDQEKKSTPWIAFEFNHDTHFLQSVSGTLFGPHLSFGFE